MNFFSTTKAPPIPTPGTPGEGQGGRLQPSVEHSRGRLCYIGWRSYSRPRYSGGGPRRGFPRTTPGLLFSIALCVILALVGPSCQTSKVAPAHSTNTDFSGDFATNSFEDACATHLVDIEGALLEYYVTMHHWPASLDELKPLSSTPLELTCPVSKQPYVYNAFGLANADRTERVVIYDATPAHSGFRWAISIIEPQDANAALVTKVIALPESQFQLTIPVK